jgi:hypothetical protein
MGSPCRIPLVGVNNSEKTPFTLTEKLTEGTYFITNFTQFSEEKERETT